MVTVDASKDKDVKITETESGKTSSTSHISYDSFQILLSMFAAVIIGMVVYFIPSYWLTSHVTRDLVLEIINFLGADATKSVSITNPSDPAIRIVLDKGRIGNYGIVRACTGMQAGAILVALILVTDAPLRNKLIAIPTFLLTLFISNVLRVAFHMLLVTWGIPFYWAHDVLSKPIGFVGTLIFAMMIERQGVPIIDTFADWMDWALQKINRFF